MIYFPWRWLIILLSVQLSVQAEERLARYRKDGHGIFSLAIENDSFVNRDNGYTNGIRFAWLSAETEIPVWLERAARQMPFFTRKGHRRYGFSLGQNMYTPDDISVRALIKNDRPYAGWLYGNVNLLSDTGARLDNLQLYLGVVGPSSRAEQIQSFIHDTIDSPDPKGWSNQLDDEPGFILFYERTWKNFYESSPLGWEMDLAPHGSFSLGNIFTNIAGGATLRAGFALPEDYGPPRIYPGIPGSDFFIPTERLGGYLFFGLEARGVAQNIFLDGNTYKDSHSVDKKHLIGDFQTGVVLTYKDLRLSYTHVFASREFKQQKDPDRFGALTLSYRL